MVDRLTAEHSDHLDAEALAVGRHGLAHLYREFPCRHEHEGGGHCGGVLADGVEHREGERCGLARAGRRLTQEVAALEQEGDGLALDRSWLGVALTLERSEQFVAQPQAGEVDGGGGAVGGNLGFGHVKVLLKGMVHPTKQRGRTRPR